MDINYSAVLLATLLQFIASAVWYTFVFGELWGRIHGFDRVPKSEQAKMQKQMLPLLAVQFVLTLVTTSVLALFRAGLPAEWNVYGEAGFFWIGFVVPTQVSAVIFGGTEGKWVMKKIFVMAGASLLNLMLAAYILSVM